MERKNPADWTELHWAVWCQDLDKVKEILATDNSSLNITDRLGWTALHLACSSHKSKIWNLHQVGLRFDRGKGPKLTTRPATIARYAALTYNSFRFAKDPLDFPERTLSFLIALDLLQAGADVSIKGVDVKGKEFCTALHCAASSGWTDHIDALIYYGAPLGASSYRECSPVCWIEGSTPDYQRALGYFRKRYGPDVWARILQDHERSSDCVGPPDFAWPTPEFEAWYFTELQPNVSKPSFPGIASAIKQEDSDPRCTLCKGISLANLRSPSGYVHAASLENLRRSSKECAVCRFFFSFLEGRVKMTRYNEISQIILRAGTDPASWPTITTLSLQLSCGCFCNVRWHDTTDSRSLDFSGCEGKCRSMLLEDIVFDFFANEHPEESIPGRILRCGIPATNRKTEESIRSTRAWLRCCEKEHDSCKARFLGDQSPLPNRVLDVSKYQISGKVRLLSSRHKSGKYVALSHRWVTGKPKWVTDTTNVGKRNQYFSPGNLPQTIRDAIFYTNRLGIKYLWVDSLCILQDSKEDWEAESVKMLEVFGSATITFFADCAENDNDGFLKARDDGIFQVRRSICLGIKHTNGTIIPMRVIQRYSRYRAALPAKASDFFQLDVVQSGLSGRGWIFQEQVVSGQRLHFGQHQMYWICGETFEAEDGTDLRPIVPGWLKWLFFPRQGRRRGRSLKENELWQQHINWGALIENYSCRALTHKKDTLRALAGLSKAFGKAFDDLYIIGCWQKCLRFDLLWAAKPRKFITDEAVQKLMSRLTFNSGLAPPTWSWLAADGAVEYPHLKADRTAISEETMLTHTYFQIEEPPECIPGDIDTFGTLPLFCGPLKVTGVLEPAKRQPSGELHDESYPPSWYVQPGGSVEECVIPLCDEQGEFIGSMIPDRVWQPPKVQVMLLKAWESVGECTCCQRKKSRYCFFIVLEPTGGDDNVFQRIGSGWTHYRDVKEARDVGKLGKKWRAKPKTFDLV